MAQKYEVLPCQIPPYHPQSYGFTEWYVKTVKMGRKAFSAFNESIEIYLPSLLLNYRTIPHTERKQSPSSLMGRQIKTPLPNSFSTKENVLWIEKIKKRIQKKQKMLLQKVHNSNIRQQWFVCTGPFGSV